MKEPRSIRTNPIALKFLKRKAQEGGDKPDYLLAQEFNRSGPWASRLKEVYPDYADVLFELVIREIKCDINAPIRGVARSAAKGDSAALERLMRLIGKWPKDTVAVTGAGGGPITYRHLSDAELERIIVEAQEESQTVQRVHSPETVVRSESTDG